MKSLKPRLLTAAVGIPLVLLVIFLSELWHPFVKIAMGIVTAIMVGEYMYANKLLRQYALSVPCMLFALVLTIFINTQYVYLMLFLLMIAAFCVVIAMHKTLSYKELSFALFGTLLISFGSSAVSIACSSQISVSFFFVLVFLLPWMADAGGFFMGATLGRHKLCPEISPKKTVEGAIGGVIFCILSALGMGFVFKQWIIPDVTINFFALGLIGLLDSVLSIVGDLSFSLIKRHLDIKDYGNIFPGHGGFLDRFDSIIFTAPAAVLVGQFLPYLSVG